VAKLKTTQVKVSALATNPDKYALPAGSCAEAKNVLARRPGVLESLTEDRQLLSVDTLSSMKPIKVFNDQLYGGRLAVVQAQAAQAPIWVSTDPETQTGIINTFVFDNKNSTPTYSSNTTTLEVAWDYGTDGFLHPVYRDPGFIPGMTHDAYNTFRTLVTEKWGVVTSFERYAGLYPPMLRLALTQVAAPAGQTLDQNNWLVPANTVSYRAVLTMESPQPTDDPSGLLSPSPKAYIVKGPPSQVFSIKQETYGDNASVTVTPTLSNLDALPKASAGAFKYFFEVYRCPQDEVVDPTRLTSDYRLVAKLAIPAPGASSFPSMGISAFPWLDDITEDGRDGGEALYTNDGQQGEQGANYCPPSCAGICVFKDTTFYANRVGLPGKGFAVAGAFGDLLTDREVKYGIGHRVLTNALVNAGTSTISITFDPSDMVGLAVGQIITCTDPIWPAGSVVRITSINTSGHTFNVSLAPTGASSAHDMVVADCIDILVHYADGTASAIAHLDPTDPVGSAIAWNPGGLPLANWPAGLRFKTLYGHVIDSYPPQEGYQFELVHTTPWHKRATRLRFQMTNHQNYAPQGLPITGAGGEWVEGTYELRRNIVYLSKTSEPEHVPLGNFQIIGAGVILKMWATVSAIFFFCTDGLWRLTGDGTTWAIDQIEPTAQLIHPDLVCSLNNKIYAMLQDGLAIITDTGAQMISEDAIGTVLRDQISQMRAVQTGSGIRTQLPYVFGPTMAADQHFNEVWWSLTEAGFGTISLIDSYIFNEDTKSFTRQTNLYKGLAYYERNQRLAYVKGTGTWTINVKNDFYSSNDALHSDFPNTMLATIEFNPLVSEDMGDLKQWMDTSFFMTLDGRIYTIWSSEFRSVTYPENNYMKLFPATHFWVPRQYVLKPTLEDFGFTTQDNFTRFELFGFTVRYRVASDTLKRA
jgi:hypothetical protein